MSKLLRLLSQSAIANQYANENRLRTFGLMRCICTDNAPPPDKPRHIRVTTGAKGGKTQTYWIQPMRLIPFYDPPMPPIGSTVICACIDGNPHDMVWLGNVINDTNPEFEQDDPVKDSSQTIPGNNTTKIEGNESNTVVGNKSVLIQGEYNTKSERSEHRQVTEDLVIEVQKNITIKAGLKVTIQNAAGAAITLTPNGAVIIGSAFGNKLVLGGGSAGVPGVSSDFVMEAAGAAVWNLGGGSINITNLSDARILNRSIATVGAVDSRGDDLVTRGW